MGANLVVRTGESFTESLTYLDDAGNPVLLSGMSVRAQARRWAGGPLIVEFTCVVTSTPGQVILLLSRDQTLGLTVSGVYDVFVLDGSDWSSLVDGKFIVKPGVTRAPNDTTSLAAETYADFDSLTWG